MSDEPTLRLRLDVLNMAQQILDQEYMFKRERAYTTSSGQTSSPAFYDTSELINKADALLKFVEGSTKPQITETTLLNEHKYNR